MKVAVLALFVACLSPALVRAQDVPPPDRAVLPGPNELDLVYAVKTLQAQVSALQKELNAARGDTRMGVVADVAYGGNRQAIINGWAFKCGPTPTPGLGTPPYKLDVLVNGMPTNHKHVIRWERPDVQSTFEAYCGAEGMPNDTGFSILIDLQDYTPERYLFQVRIKDRGGVVLTSNTVGATISR